MMNVEQSVGWELAGETEVLGENLPQYHFIQISGLTVSGGEASGSAVTMSASTATTQVSTEIYVRCCWIQFCAAL
jgi:hypothetical protein